MSRLKVRKIDDNVYVIREDWRDIDHRFYTKFTNLYLLVGEKKALLLDTSMGIHSIKELISPIIKNKELLVFNSHHHFDHVAGNKEFSLIYVHKFDLKLVSKERDISFLRGIKTKASEYYKKTNYKVLPAKEFYPVEDHEEFDLGKLKITIIHTPGHTKGSVSLISNKGHLFTADTVHEGAVFLPPKENLPEYLETLEKLQKITDTNTYNREIKLYPGHEKVVLPKTHISLLRKRIQENVMKEDLYNYKYDTFLEARIIFSEPFIFVVPVNKDESYSIN